MVCKSLLKSTKIKLATSGTMLFRYRHQHRPLKNPIVESVNIVNVRVNITHLQYDQHSSCCQTHQLMGEVGVALWGHLIPS